MKHQPSVTTVSELIKELSSSKKNVIFEGQDRRGCALEDNVIAFIHFEICHLAVPNEKGNKQQQQQQRFCRISRLELNDGNRRAEVNQLPHISAFPLDKDEYATVRINDESSSKNKKDEDSMPREYDESKKNNFNSQQDQDQEQQQQQFTLTNVELVGCSTGVLIWRPNKQRHFFLRIKDGFLITLWTENPVVHARVGVEKDPSLFDIEYQEASSSSSSAISFPTSAHFLTENNLIEGFNLDRVTPTLIALRVFRARLKIPLASVSADEETLSPLSSSDRKSINNNAKTDDNASLAASATTAAPSVLFGEQPSPLRSPAKQKQQSTNSFTSNFVSSPDKHRQRQINATKKKNLHAISFCEVPTHRLLNMRVGRFLLQIAEAKDVFAFALPSITAENDEDFDSLNHFHPVCSSSSSMQNEEAAVAPVDSNAARNEDEGYYGDRFVGRQIIVSCHHIPLAVVDDEEEPEDTDENGDIGRKSNNNAQKQNGVTVPVKLIDQDAKNKIEKKLIAAHCSAMHTAIVDVQAGTYCLMLTRRGANCAEFFLFSEHCILRALSPKTSSGHHRELLHDHHHHHHHQASEPEESIASASMFLYDSIPLVSSSSSATEIRCAVSVANPNFFILSYSNTNETDRTLNFAICLPVFDRRRKVWTACVASQRKLWKGESIPVLGGDPYPPSPLCCPLPSGYFNSATTASSSSSTSSVISTTSIRSVPGQIQQHLPGSDKLAIFDYHAENSPTNSLSSSTSLSATSVSFVNWTDLWISTIYSRLDEKGATFTLTKLDEMLQPLTGETSPIAVSVSTTAEKKSVNLSDVLSAASKQATSIFAQVRHGILSTSSSLVLPSHENAAPRLSHLEQNDLALLEYDLNQRHAATGKKLGEIVLTNIKNLAHRTSEFEKKIERESIRAHEEFFRNQGVDVIRNTFQQLEETRSMLQTLRIGLEDAEAESKMIEEEADEDHDQFLQDLLEKASTPQPLSYGKW